MYFLCKLLFFDAAANHLESPEDQRTLLFPVTVLLPLKVRRAEPIVEVEAPEPAREGQEGSGK